MPLLSDHTLLNALIPAFGWTLLHSLWQGLIAACLTLVILLLTKKSSPAFRYIALTVLFGSFVLAIIITFCIQYNETAISNAAIQSTTISTTIISAANQPIASYNPGYISTFESAVNSNINLIVSLWFILLCVQAVRLGFGLNYINKIRKQGITVPSVKWLQVLEQLKNELAITKPVILLESRIVRIPVAIGFFRPLILIPASLMMNLPYDQVRSILLHELAHIKREDYLVNMIQNIIETIFFFNPAVIWISSTIREEREACCDAMALKFTSSKSDYLQALVSFQEYSMQASGLALAFPGKKGSLLHRVKRIIYNENKNLSVMQKTVLICSIVLLTAASIIPANEIKAWNFNPLKFNMSIAKVTDSVPEAPDPPPCPTVIILQQMKVSDSTIPSEPFIYVEGMKLVEPLKPLDPPNPPEPMKAIALVPPVSPIDMVPPVAPIEPLAPPHLEPALPPLPPTAPVPPVVPLDHLLPVPAIAPVQPDKHAPITVEGHPLHPVTFTYKNAHTEDAGKETEEIIKVLLTNNVIREKSGTTFKLSANELVVNNVKQSENLHQQLKLKYIKNAGDFFNYTAGKKENGTLIFYDQL